MRELKTVGKWHKRFLEMALMVATWSKDVSTCVGSCVVRDKFLISVGFNGRPAGVSDEETTRDIRLLTSLHSEVNAILSAKQDLTGCTLYCSHPPCSNCAAAICQSGITAVYCIKPKEDFSGRWEESMKQASKLFSEKRIDFFCIDEGLL
jgi:dCMP deaminase